MLKPIATPLGRALLVAAALIPATAHAQDDRCTGGQTPGGVIIVQFDRAQSILTPRAQRELAATAKKALAQKVNLLCLEGFADAWLGQERDLALAQARADAVANELAANGYPRDRIVIRRISDPKRVLRRKETTTERKVEIRYGR
jgi:outer membrane protein OmpA-like peptidoglycan-associated protein